MCPSNFLWSLCAQKFWRVRTFLGIHPELKRFLCRKFGGDKKKKGFHPEMERFFCPKLREDQNKNKKSSSA